MKADLNDIFVVTGQCPAQQQLLDYVQGKLSAAEQHEIEKHVADCELCSDALEGLAAIQQKERIPAVVKEMKWQLMRKLRRQSRRKRKLGHNIELALIVMVVLFLLLAAFWIFYFVNKG